MIVLLRGHIRNAFDNDMLYNLLKSLYQISPYRLYIHTWNIQQNSLSWRDIQHKSTLITETQIRAYMRDLSSYICHICIDPDGGLPLIGSADGLLIPGGHMPKRGWKNMWAGMERSMSIIAEEYPNELVLNTRFDVCNNSNNFTVQHLLTLYKYVAETRPETIVFLKKVLFNGCDNYFAGPVHLMANLIHDFHTELDTTLAKYPLMVNHERYVMMHAAHLEKGVPK